MKVIVHRPARGLEGRSASSVKDAYARMIARNPDGVELDVRVTADGVPIVAHDPSTRLMTRLPRPLRSLRYADLPAGTFLPLDELMPTFSGFGARVYVEIKDTDEAPVARVLDVLEPFRQQIWFISLPWKREAITHIRRRWADARTNQIVIHPALAGVARARSAGVEAVTFGWSGINAFRRLSPDRVRRFVDAGRDAGLEVSAGLANSAADRAWAVRMGFEMVWLDPHALDKARGALAKPI